jgi:VWFA-related protein
MIAYLKKVPPGTRIAIFTLASRLRFVQGFTSDISSVLAALNNPKNGANQSVLLEDTNNIISSSYDSTLDPNAAVDSVLQFEADVTAVQTDIRVQITLDALRQLAHSLDGFPGRKNLIWVSGSFPIDLGPDVTSNNPFWAQRNYRQQLQEVDDLLAADRIAVYPVDARGLIPNSTFVANPVNSPLSDALSLDHSNMGSMGHRPSASGAIGTQGAAISPGSPGQFARQVAAEHGTMRQIAEQSGGVAFYESNGFNKAFAAAIGDGANYYTLAYSPGNAQLDGKFRKIEVKLLGANNTKDVNTAKYALSYRRGYFADPPQAKPTKATAWAAGSSMVHNAPNSARLFFQAKVLPASGGPVQNQQSDPDSAGTLTHKLQGPLQRYSIDFLADMHRVNADFGDDGRRYSTLEFIAIAYDAQGKILNYSDRTFKRVIPPAKYGEVLQGGWPMHQELNVPAGDIYLRLGVRDTTTGWLGSLEIPIKVATKNQEN